MLASRPISAKPLAPKRNTCPSGTPLQAHLAAPPYLSLGLDRSFVHVQPGHTMDASTFARLAVLGPICVGSEDDRGNPAVLHPMHGLQNTEDIRDLQ